MRHWFLPISLKLWTAEAVATKAFAVAATTQALYEALNASYIAQTNAANGDIKAADLAQRADEAAPKYEESTDSEQWKWFSFE